MAFATYLQGQGPRGIVSPPDREGMGRSFQITSTFSKLTAFQNIRIGILSKRGIHYNMFRNVDKMKDITRETDEILILPGRGGGIRMLLEVEGLNTYYRESRVLQDMSFFYMLAVNSRDICSPQT